MVHGGYHIREIKHIMLCVAGMYLTLRDITNTFSPVLHLNVSHLSICSSSILHLSMSCLSVALLAVVY